MRIYTRMNRRIARPNMPKGYSTKAPVMQQEASDFLFNRIGANHFFPSFALT
jgi:hypothetical protein